MNLSSRPLKGLPIETLYDLLVFAARELVMAAESTEDREIQIKAKKKQLEAIIMEIDSRKPPVVSGSAG